MALRGLTALLGLGSLLLGAALPPLAAADDAEPDADVADAEVGRPSAWHVRVAAAGALMISTDQLGWLAYDRPGVLGDVQLGYAVLPWLDIQVGTSLGVFLSEQANGGLAAPMVGALARIPNSRVAPYAFADFGGAFTGALLLPMLRAGVGLEVPVSDSLRLGPVVSFGSVLFSDNPGDSTDARYVAIGLAGVYSHVPARPLPRKLVAKPPPAAPRVIVVREPSTEILKLVDQAVPGRTDQVELLAPVLFAFDSDELEPVGIAMLHEVARSLGERTDLELIEIRAYSDARGSAEYNRDLAARRGQRVYDWLIAHDIDPARLAVAPVGASEFVETGAAETAHEQNRRVVFRVLRIGAKQ
jgi:outer membrane protein OmpA-like peptidoglycan-associated protein